jgi:hypothetical protein
MGLEVGGVNHDFLGIPAAFGKLDEDAPEHAHLAPADETVVDCLVRPVTCGHVAPPQAIADHEDDAADHTAIIDTRHPVRQRKERRNPRHLVFGKQDHLGHGSTPLVPPVNQ